MQLRFKLLTGRVLTREVQEDVTAAAVKEMLSEELLVYTAPDRITLIFKPENQPGRRIRDEESIFNQNVGCVDDSMLFVVLRMGGGG